MEANPTFEITTLQNENENGHGHGRKKLHCLLYMYHTPLGPNRNQRGVPAVFANGVRTIVVNDWPIHDSLGPQARIIARGRGHHFQSGINKPCWASSFNIVFDHGRFKGSTLQVMGIVVEAGEWSIVGGTGEFTLARGVIYKKFIKQNHGGNIIELDVHAFYATFPKQFRRPVIP